MDNQVWTEVCATVKAEDVERAGDIAQMTVPYGIYIEDYSHLEEEAWEIAHIDLIDEELLKKRGSYYRLWNQLTGEDGEKSNDSDCSGGR